MEGCCGTRRGGATDGLRCRGCWGGGSVGWVGWYGLIEPPRPPPPVILPGAAFASLCLAGALRRASPFGLALPPAGWEGCGSCLRTEGRGKNPSWGGVDVTSDNRQDSNPLRLARVPRRGLRGPGPQVLPTTSASRAVRWNPVTGFFRAPVCRYFFCPANWSSLFLKRTLKVVREP